MLEKVVKSDEHWQRELTPEQYQVARKGGTEPAFTGDLWDHKGEGHYACVCCGAALFHSETKFESGTGWPSFWQPICDESIAEETDQSYGMVRTEVKCSRCDAHLGHVFPDGPRHATGLRYCINSVSLQFCAREQQAEGD